MKHLALATIVCVVAAGALISAHHGYAAFDRNRVVTVEGVLEELVYANPHIVMKLRSDAGIFIASWESPNTVLRRAQFTATTFHLGDRIVVSGNPSVDASKHQLALLKEVRRPSDGWKWTDPKFSHAN